MQVPASSFPLPLSSYQLDVMCRHPLWIVDEVEIIMNIQHGGGALELRADKNLVTVLQHLWRTVLEISEDDSLVMVAWALLPHYWSPVS